MQFLIINFQQHKYTNFLGAKVNWSEVYRSEIFYKPLYFTKREFSLEKNVQQKCVTEVTYNEGREIPSTAGAIRNWKRKWKIYISLDITYVWGNFVRVPNFFK